MMRKFMPVLLAMAVSGGAWAAENAEAEAVEEKVDEALEFEIAYVEQLINNAFPDLAQTVIEETKKKWPESETRFFALEIRGMLGLGDFAGAEKKIAALPDRNGAKYWAARIEIANNYYQNNKKEECSKIYSDFFEKFQTPPKELRKFYMDASYTYGQILKMDKRFDKAVDIYARLLKQIPRSNDNWLDLASETAEMYLKVAEDAKDKSARDAALKGGESIADKLLYRTDSPVFFGRGVSMKAHAQMIRGNVQRAVELVDEYLPTLKEIHAQILEADPDGSLGYVKLSPLPECLYLQAKMMWDEAQAEIKKPGKRDDEKIKALMFGTKDKSSGKRDGKGAFNLSVKIFLNYELTPWAAPAGEMSEEIREFAVKTYKANIKTKITPEQIAKARAAQFKSAREKFDNGQFVDAIREYEALLVKYPESKDSIWAVANIANSLLDLLHEEKDEAKKEEYRDYADAVEGYISERFAGNRDKVVMTDAGNLAVGLAAKEKERGELERAERIYTDFVLNYRRHPNSATLAAGKAGEAQKAEKWEEAIRYWGYIDRYYTNSTYFAAALAQLSYCNGKLGNRKEEIDYIGRYLGVEQIKIRRLQAQFQLAGMYKTDGLDILNGVETNVAPENVEAEEKRGSAQIIRAIKQYSSFSKEADAAIRDPATLKDDLAKYKELREGALFLVGACWGRINRPEKNLKMYRERAAASYEDYLKDYPEGKYAKGAYVNLGSLYTALGDMEKSKDALDRLSKKFPDSDEAKNAKPRLAKNLIEMGLKKEGTELYAEMLRTEGGDYSARQFLDAGEALIAAKSWDLANQAFEKSIRLAGTNSVVTVAKARLGLAKTSWKQGAYAEAREALDLFLNDPKMSKMAIAADANFMLVEVASQQGRTEKDATMRGKYFGAAVGALKKVKSYWSKKEPWEQASLHLMSGDVMVNRMNAEEAMGLKAEAAETCERAAAHFQVFLQANGVSESHPIEKMSPGELNNLERCYASMVPLFSKLGSSHAENVLRFGEEYLKYFPNGKHATDMSNYINRAKADLPAGGVEKKVEKVEEVEVEG